MNNYLVVLLILFYVAALAVVCRAVSKSDCFTKTQKLLQIVLCGTVPVFGMVFVWVFLKLDGSSRKKDNFIDEGPNA